MCVFRAVSSARVSSELFVCIEVTGKGKPLDSFAGEARLSIDSDARSPFMPGVGG